MKIFSKGMGMVLPGVIKSARNLYPFLPLQYKYNLLNLLR